MPIILFLGKNVKEYTETSKKSIQKLLEADALRCETCLQPLKRHSSYKRKIKETNEKLAITIIRCKACNKGHALLPDFLLYRKHYSGNEIEHVIIESASCCTEEIDTEASIQTIKRWITEMGDRIKRSCSIIKHLFKKAGKAISELSIIPGTPYSELEQLLEKAPQHIRYSGNKLGLANLWIGTNEVRAYL